MVQNQYCKNCVYFNTLEYNKCQECSFDIKGNQSNFKQINEIIILDDDDDSIGDLLDKFCPKCKREYDEIDYEYQICHHCKFNNTKII